MNINGTRVSTHDRLYAVTGFTKELVLLLLFMQSILRHVVKVSAVCS